MRAIPSTSSSVIISRSANRSTGISKYGALNVELPRSTLSVWGLDFGLLKENKESYK